MDIIFLHNFTIYTKIGVFDWEKKIEQKLIMDIDAGFNFDEAARTDDVSKTLDYGKLAQSVEAFAEANQYQLLESFGENLIKHLQTLFSIPWVKIKITKPGILPNVGAVGIIIERGLKE